MPSLEYLQVNVFSDRPFAGNMLPVFFEAEDLSAADMLAIGQELRQFETVFVGAEEAPGRVAARIFDLFEELPFAGHPLLGAAAALQQRTAPRGSGLWEFRLTDRLVPVSVTGTSTGYAARMHQGVPEFYGEVKERGKIAEAFGLEGGDLAPDLPIEVVSTGLRYMVVPLRPERISAAHVDVDIAELMRLDGAQYGVLFDPAAREIRHWNNDGRTEDAATGSAAGVIGAYSHKHAIIGRLETLLLSQGRCIGRPSRIEVEVAHDGVSVGGNVALLGAGSLLSRPGDSA